MEIDLKKNYKISKYVQMINKENITMVCSTGYGTHLKMPAECWEAIKRYVEAYTPQEICDAACAEDREYYMKIFTSLIYKKILVSGREGIDTVDMAITHRCNLHCTHCAASAVSVSEKEYLSTEQWKTVIDNVLAVKPELVVLTGGEPMVRNDFFELLRYIVSRYSGKLELMTNGLLINSDNIDEIVKSFGAISLSIDGYDEETCAAIRGKGVFEKVVHVVHQLIDHGFDRKYISLSMVETAVTNGKTDKFSELCSSLGVKCIPRLFSPIGRGLENNSWLSPGTAEAKAVEASEQKMGETKADNKNFQTAIPCRSCRAGRGKVSISAKGEIFPCQMLDDEKFQLGNALECSDISKMIVEKDGINTSGLKNYEQMLKGSSAECADCEVQIFCRYCAAAEFYAGREADSHCEGRRKFLSKMVWGM